jgi:hydroxyacylglutathione hydrolase
MEMLIEMVPLGPLETNCYVIKDEFTHKAIVIDPGMNPKPLWKKIEEYQVEAILLTHAHFDHIGSVDELRKWKKCPVYLHDLEADWLTDPKKNGSIRYPELGAPIHSDLAEFALADGQVIQMLGLHIQVLHTPGHSPGSVSFIVDKHLFGGDVLFKLSVGRTDLPGGHANTLIDSIHQKLFKQKDDTIVYPGHGPKTTIGYERMHNPYV